MKTRKRMTALDLLVDSVSGCMTPESARRLLAVKPDAAHQSRMTYLADQCNEGHLTDEEAAEYREMVAFGTSMAILQSKARQLLQRGTMNPTPNFD